jgi:hypothetical protein
MNDRGQAIYIYIVISILGATTIGVGHSLPFIVTETTATGSPLLSRSETLPVTVAQEENFSGSTN